MSALSDAATAASNLSTALAAQDKAQVQADADAVTAKQSAAQVIPLAQATAQATTALDQALQAAGVTQAATPATTAPPVSNVIAPPASA